MAFGKSTKMKTKNRREHEFALKSHNEIAESLSGPRVRKRVMDLNSDNSGVNKTKRTAMTKSNRGGNFGETLVRNENVNGIDEREMIGDEKEKKVRRKMKDLFQTRVLEGYKVRYIHGVHKKVLTGVIKGDGILCSCNNCNGQKVISPSRFEVHAESKNKNAADYIFLENNKNLRYVLNECLKADLNSLSTVIRNAIGISPNQNSHQTSIANAIGSSPEPVSEPNEPIYEPSPDYTAIIADSNTHAEPISEPGPDCTAIIADSNTHAEPISEPRQDCTAIIADSNTYAGRISDEYWALILVLVVYAAYRLHKQAADNSEIAHGATVETTCNAAPTPNLTSAEIQGIAPTSAVNSPGLAGHNGVLGGVSHISNTQWKPTTCPLPEFVTGECSDSSTSVGSTWNAAPIPNSISAPIQGIAPRSPDNSPCFAGYTGLLGGVSPASSAQVVGTGECSDSATVETTWNAAPIPNLTSAEIQGIAPTSPVNSAGFAGYTRCLGGVIPNLNAQWKPTSCPSLEYVTGECSHSIRSGDELISGSVQPASPERTCKTAPTNASSRKRKTVESASVERTWANRKSNSISARNRGIAPTSPDGSIHSANGLISNLVQHSTPERTSNTAPKSNLSSSKGRIKKKDLSLHKLVFQNDVLPDGTELTYFSKGQVSPSVFESHAGFPRLKKPYSHIYTSNGMTLHELSVKISPQRGVSTDVRKLCSVCHATEDSEDLQSCNGCPRVYHLGCVSQPNIQNGKWYCEVCDPKFQMERVAERNPNAIAAGRIPGVGPMQQIVNIPNPQDSVCALCRTQDYSKTGFGPRTMIICDQCEKEYHVGCLKEHEMHDLQELPAGPWFCSSDCESINFALKELLNKGDQGLPDDLVDVIKSRLTEEDLNGNDLDISWRVIHGKMSSQDVIPLLAKAVSVFHERFSRIYSGKQDLIPHMVYARDVSGSADLSDFVKNKEMEGMYCAVLTVNSTIVSAAVFRLFDKEIAEIPLIATSNGSDGKGYFYSLYTCIERLLKELGVKNLVLHAAKERQSIWRNRYGFNGMPKAVKELTELYTLTEFSGTSVLHKMIAESSD